MSCHKIDMQRTNKSPDRLYLYIYICKYTIALHVLYVLVLCMDNCLCTYIISWVTSFPWMIMSFALIRFNDSYELSCLIFYGCSKTPWLGHGSWHLMDHQLQLTINKTFEHWPDSFTIVTASTSHCFALRRSWNQLAIVGTRTTIHLLDKVIQN